MRWMPNSLASGLILGVATIPMVAHAKIYLSIDQAKKIMFGTADMQHRPIILTKEIQENMRQASSVSHTFESNRIWKSPNGGWFIVDEVVGKHEMITYALGINPDGTIKQVEILEYRESYGFEVSDAVWRQQFVGKKVNAPLKLNQDIQNISGATLSSKHLTDGVKRLMVMHDLALKNY